MGARHPPKLERLVSWCDCPRFERARDRLRSAHVPDAAVEEVVMKGHTPAEPNNDVTQEAGMQGRNSKHSQAVPDKTKRNSLHEIRRQSARGYPSETAFVLPNDPVVLQVVEDRQRGEDRQKITEQRED